jgi:hypothetical protein
LSAQVQICDKQLNYVIAINNKKRILLMLETIFKIAAAIMDRATGEAAHEKFLAKQSATRAFFAQRSDEELAAALTRQAEWILRCEAVYPHRVGFECTEMNDVLEVVKERIKADGLDQHPTLAPIVRALAALPPSQMVNHTNTTAPAVAILNAVRENEWQKLAAAEPAPAP